MVGDANNSKSKSRAPLFAMLGLGVLAAAGVVLFLGSRAPGAPPSASASVAAPSPPMRSTAALIDPVAPTPAPVAPVAPEPVVLPSAVAPDPSAPVVRPQEPNKPKPIVQAPPAVFKPKPPTPSPKTSSGSDLSDFGGRR